MAKPNIGNAKVMSSADDISAWYDAVQLYDAGRVDEAVEMFKQTKQNAKMMLNIGCCYLRKHDLKSAAEVIEKPFKVVSAMESERELFNR